MFQTGTMLEQRSLAKDTFKVMDRSNRQIWSTPIDKEAWQNFAFTLDFAKKCVSPTPSAYNEFPVGGCCRTDRVTSSTVQVYYSKGDDPLKSVTSAVSNNLAGAGQFQLGILKKPTGTTDVVNSGFQESRLNEGQIYGGVFVEDSAGGCVSL